jgi:hypothetical protein
LGHHIVSKGDPASSKQKHSSWSAVVSGC